MLGIGGTFPIATEKDFAAGATRLDDLKRRLGDESAPDGIEQQGLLHFNAALNPIPHQVGEIRYVLLCFHCFFQTYELVEFREDGSVLAARLVSTGSFQARLRSRNLC